MPLKTTDARMLQLIELLKQYKTIRFTQQFCDAIGIEKQNIRNIKLGSRRFTVEHIEQACKAYHVNPAWIFGYSDNVFLRKNITATTFQPKNAATISATEIAKQTGKNTLF